MTDRFYPHGKHQELHLWKTTYEIANEMRSLQRSAYPPGYAGHEPGAREKFGYSTPGPDAMRLTRGDLCLKEEVDNPNPRATLAFPRHQVTNERALFDDQDVPEMNKSYRSSIVSPSFRSMAKSQSLPTIQRKPAPPRCSMVADPVAQLEDQDFNYFVPKGLNKESPERLMSRSLSKLYKSPEKKVMMPFAGDGTGFRTSCAATDWWPSGGRLAVEPSSYVEAYGKVHPIQRMSARPPAD